MYIEREREREIHTHTHTHTHVGKQYIRIYVRRPARQQRWLCRPWHPCNSLLTSVSEKAWSSGVCEDVGLLKCNMLARLWAPAAGAPGARFRPRSVLLHSIARTTCVVRRKPSITRITREQLNTPLLRCHPDRLTIQSTNNVVFKNAWWMLKWQIKGYGRPFRVVGL